MTADADKPSELLREGHTLFFAEPPDYPGAVERFERVVALRPNSAEGYVWLGSALEKIGDSPRAAKAWQTAHNLDPQDSRSLINLGILRSSERNFDEAITLLEQGIALKPHYGFADSLLYLAEAFEGAKKLKQAKQTWREVLELEPMYPSFDHPMNEARRKLRQHGETD